MLFVISELPSVLFPSGWLAKTTMTDGEHEGLWNRHIIIRMNGAEVSSSAGAWFIMPTCEEIRDWKKKMD
jgi:hypothetical protein